ncbi:MAG: hypothetical protein MCSN_3820 [Candidatus Microsyncoccus archaeolyticus]|nr:MAG: hypothetical protein MCSN_3820 [Candidatus Parcubacteria bacterium]
MKVALALVACMIFCALMCGCTDFFGETTPENMLGDDSPKMIIGASKIELRTEDKPVIGAQVDRVIRDYLWTDSAFDTKVPADRIPQDSSQVVPYMEGARVKEMMDWAGASVLPLTPCTASLWEDGQYYTCLEQLLCLPILEDKVNYPTSVFYANEKNVSMVNIYDTHGFNAVASKAYDNKDKIDVVIACMDTPSKAEAALWIAENGMNCYAPCDRFTNELMDYKHKFGIEAEIIGSAPIRKTDYGAVIGDQPVTILLDEKIIVQYTEEGYPNQYCDTPKRYFDKLQQVFGLDLNITEVYANVGETYKIVEKAQDEGAHVIAVRVNNEQDYYPVKSWLSEDKNNRAILFHSAAYDPGMKLFREFPKQTSFGDINPQIIY